MINKIFSIAVVAACFAACSSPASHARLAPSADAGADAVPPALAETETPDGAPDVDSGPDADTFNTVAPEAGTPPRRCSGFSGPVWEFGDSITAGKGGTAQAGYRPELAVWMTDGCPVAFVGTGAGPEGAHEGHPGFDLQQLRNVAAHVYVGHQHIGSVNLIVLMAGVNNMDTVTPYDSVATPALYAALLDDISIFPESRILVTTITSHQSDLAESRIIDFNSKLPAIWDAWDARHPSNHLLRADQFRALGGAWSAELFSDVVHPNSAGYTRMANEWIRVLSNQKSEKKAEK